MSGNPLPPWRWEIVKRLLLEVLAQPVDERTEFLENACGEDGALFAEVESLLAHHDEAVNSAFLDAGRPQQIAEHDELSGQATWEESRQRHESHRDSSSVERTDPTYREEPQATSGQGIAELVDHRYEVMELVGEGGMGLVYRGRHRKLDMDVAIKVLRPGGSADRFLREARVLAQIKSPHVVRIHDFDVADDVPVLVMEWVEGRDLLQVMLDVGGPVPEEPALRWMKDVCNGMLAAEAEGIIHRDLKPSNILIDRQDQARVADFGLARHSSSADEMSRTGGVMGTVYYMSPEQAENPRGVDTRADIYSFGATFYHALTGKPPFSGPTAFSILRQHQTEPIISPRERCPDISDHTCRILERCLAKAPGDRFQTFSALRRHIEAAAPSPKPAAAGPFVLVYDNQSEDPLFQTWGICCIGADYRGQISLMTTCGRIDVDELTPDVPERPSELRLEAFENEHVGVNLRLPHLAGRARFEYRAIVSESLNPNLLFCVIPMQNGPLLEVGAQDSVEPENANSPFRRRFFIPDSHVGDGSWHEADIDFDFRSEPTAAYTILAPRINEGCPRPGPGGMLVRNVQLFTRKRDG